jgi:hypothetical protein
MKFADYLKAAVHRAIKDEAEDLELFMRLCRRGVYRNWKALTPEKFLSGYHWCIAGISKRADVLGKYWDSQVSLFRQHDPARIVADRHAIRREWQQGKRFLHPKTVEAMITTAGLVNRSWDDFKGEYLPLPENPESELLPDWSPSHAALDRLPRVGFAVSWFLIRNLFGAPFFKPDLHINAITHHFFKHAERPLEAMSQAVHELWEEVCSDERLKPVHLGEVDYILWWYRANTGIPAATASVGCDRQHDRFVLDSIEGIKLIHPSGREELISEMDAPGTGEREE